MTAGASLTVAQRKRQGLFLTPVPLARHLASLVVGAIPSDCDPRRPWLLDPFVGTGILLDAAVDALVDRGHQGAARSRLLGQCCGLDVDGGLLAEASARFRGAQTSDDVQARQGNRWLAVDALRTPVAALLDQFPHEIRAQGGFDVVVANPPWEKVRLDDREFFEALHPGFARLPRPQRDQIRSCRLADVTVLAAYRDEQARVRALAEEVRASYTTGGSGGDLDCYKLAVERCLALTRPGGVLGLIVPHGLLGDWGARRLRQLLLGQHELLEVVRFETGPDLFGDVHANLGVVLAVVRKGPGPGNRGAPASLASGSAGGERSVDTGALRLSPTAHSLEDLARSERLCVPRALIARATAHAMIPLVETQADVAFLEHCLALPTFEALTEPCKPARQIDMTNDRAAFVAPGRGIPLLEGKHLSPYCLRAEGARYGVDPRVVPPAPRFRVAWRAVADRAMARRLVAAWVPANVALGNSLISVGSDRIEDVPLLLWLLAWLNSRVAEAQIRLWSANNNINLFHLRACRLPAPPAPGHPLIEHAAALSAAGGAELPGAWARAEMLDAPAHALAGQIEGAWLPLYGCAAALWQDTVERHRTTRLTSAATLDRHRAQR